VQGKYDPEPVHLYLWVDEECPEFCLVRHLLVYVYLAGIKAGFLFPMEKELMAMPPADGTFTTGLS
jgi:hypothetical protein